MPANLILPQPASRTLARKSVVTALVSNSMYFTISVSMGVDPDEKVGGTGRFVTKPFAVGVWGRHKPPPVRRPGGKRILAKMF